MAAEKISGQGRTENAVETVNNLRAAVRTGISFPYARSILPRQVSQGVLSDRDFQNRCLKETDAFTGSRTSEFFKDEF